MTRYHRFEVEPLPDRRWAEIDRRVLGTLAATGPVAPPSLERSRRGLVAAFSLASAATLASAAAALFALSSAEPTRGAMSHVTTDRSESVASVGDVRMEVAALSSVIWFERSPDEYMVSIEHGSARFLVPPRAGRPAFVVQAGDVSVEVVGTRFRVTRPAGASSGTVEVEEGTVRVTAMDQEHLVHGGGRWPAPDADAATPPAEASGSAPLGGESAEPGEAPSSIAVPHPDPAPSNHASSDPSAEVSGPPGESPDVRGASAARREAAAATPAAVPEHVEPAAATGGGREEFALAESLETREPGRAIELYAEIARGSTPWAANALFAQARLEIESGQRELGRTHLARYLLRYPDGANVEDARALLERSR